jgi:hypothetical protein
MIDEILNLTKITQQQWIQAMGSSERIEKISTLKGVYWLKKAAPARGVFRYFALNLFSFILRTPLLKAVPQKGGQIALDTEVSRIETLMKHEIKVPKIIAKDKGWILLEDLGDSIIEEMKANRTNIELIRKNFEICLSGIKKLHMKGQYLSQGFARNLLKIKNSDEIGFIDFEDDPLDVLTLDQAQARDLLLFVNSTARFFVKDKQFFNQQIKEFLNGHQQQVVECIKKTNQKLMWITKIPFQKLLGHDYQKLKMGILALKT